MSSRAHREINFQNYIIDRLVEQGWKLGNTKDYDVENAVYPQDIEDWIKNSGQEDKWGKLQRLNGNKTLDATIKRLVKELGQDGTAQVIRKGFSIPGAGRIDMSQSAPEDQRNDKVISRYKANILRVVPELKYHPSRELAIDLVFFINGLPVATVEVKTDLTQDVDKALEQYKKDRQPTESNPRRVHPLLTFKRGAVVHFAMSDSQIMMTTKLNGEETVFLPFNKGNDGHAGNPPATKNTYPVEYFWKEICKPDAWLRIFHNFVYVETKDKQNAQGQYFKQETLMFPRFHQWDAVNKMLNDAKANGPGQNYLCDHSAGSGKTSTISWTAHDLIKLRKDNGDAVFNSVIIVTDRNVLDGQLQDAVTQIDHQASVIAAIKNDKGSESKSKQLAEKLISGTPIIVVTIQTFPFAMEEIITNKALKDKNFAVIIDEAHNSQTGATATKLQAALKMSGEGKMASLTVDELLEKLQSSRARPDNISYFAFTGTPKHQTLMLFGRPENKDEPASKENQPKAFHTYSMRQAIEEGFIIDVLKGYMPYKTAYKISKDIEDHKRVHSKQAKRALAKWMALHPTNVTQKVEFIVEHFAKNVASLLNSTAKAMIVTSSRAAVVRYKLALEEYIKKHPEHDYISLVAFSGKVSGKEVIHQDDDTKGFSPHVSEDDEFTEENMNPDANGQDLRLAFDRPECRLMLVANKFQTGFDQPKLVAMYVDKKIANPVEIVQTFARLNRKSPGKDRVFIIDFVNDPDVVQEAFKLYDSGAKLEEIQSYDIVYDIKKRLDAHSIYTDLDLEAYKDARFKTIRDIAREANAGSQHNAIFVATDKPTRLYDAKLQMLYDAIRNWEATFTLAKEKGDKDGMAKAEHQQKEYSTQLKAHQEFKKDLGFFCRVYSYIAQLIDFGDPQLENFACFAQALQKRLSNVPVEDIDLSGLVLSDFEIKGRDAETKEGKDPILKPIDAGGSINTGDDRAYLKEILEKLNRIFGNKTPAHDQLAFLDQITKLVSADNTVMAQIENNTKEQAMKGNLPNSVEQSVARALSSHQKLAMHILRSDKQGMSGLVELIYDLIQKGVDPASVFELLGQ